MRKINGAWHVIVVLYSLGFGLMVQAQSTSFHSAPTSAKDLTPPSMADSGASGQPLYERHCASCHGATGQGTGNIPSLTTAIVKSASPGELFWFISKGDPSDGMPSWEQLPEKQRWQIVSFLKAFEPLGAAAPGAADAETSFEVAAVPKPPFTDYRFEQPGQIHKIVPVMLQEGGVDQRSAIRPLLWFVRSQ
jgi:mono/diheme cytochrome c family protein